MWLLELKKKRGGEGGGGGERGGGGEGEGGGEEREEGEGEEGKEGEEGEEEQEEIVSGDVHSMTFVSDLEIRRALMESRTKHICMEKKK